MELGHTFFTPPHKQLKLSKWSTTWSLLFPFFFLEALFGLLKQKSFSFCYVGKLETTNNYSIIRNKWSSTNENRLYISWFQLRVTPLNYFSSCNISSPFFVLYTMYEHRKNRNNKRIKWYINCYVNIKESEFKLKISKIILKKWLNSHLFNLHVHDFYIFPTF